MCLHAENPCAGVFATSSGGLPPGVSLCSGRGLITIQSPGGDSDLDPPWSVEAHRCHDGL